MPKPIRSGKSRAREPYTDAERAALLASLCSWLRSGRSGTQWHAQQDGVRRPDADTILEWRKADPAVNTAVEDARQDGAHTLIDEVVAIADAPEPEAEPGQRKVRCWARLEAAKRLHPKRYGDQLKHEVGVDADFDALLRDALGIPKGKG